MAAVAGRLFSLDMSMHQGWYNTVRVMYRIVPIQYCNVTYRIVS